MVGGEGCLQRLQWFLVVFCTFFLYWQHFGTGICASPMQSLQLLRQMGQARLRHLVQWRSISSRGSMVWKWLISHPRRPLINCNYEAYIMSFLLLGGESNIFNPRNLGFQWGPSCWLAQPCVTRRCSSCWRSIPPTREISYVFVQELELVDVDIGCDLFWKELWISAFSKTKCARI